MQAQRVDKAPGWGLFRYSLSWLLHAKLTVVLCCLCLLCAAASVQAAGPGKAAIATAHPLATEAGHQILAAGGRGR